MVRDTFLPVGKPVLDEKEVEAVSAVLRSGWLTTGPSVKAFEEGMKEYVGAKHAVGLTSCTGGLHISLSALGIGKGDEVIVPTYTFAATGHVIDWVGAKPILVDVEKDTFNIDPKKAEAAITARTKAIMLVHFAGHSCDMDAFMVLAKKHNLYIIEDAAHAIGTSYKGKKIGTFGISTVFSFYATKTITTGEGGMLTTNDEEFGKKIKRYSYFGVDKDAFNRYSDKGTWYYEIIDLGYKYNMDNIQGAMGVEQLKKIGGFLEQKKKLVQRYNKLLKDVKGVTTPIEKPYTTHSWHLYPILLDPQVMDRDTFILKLREQNIGTSVHFIPLHLHPYYQRVHGHKKGDFPNAEYIYEREVSLPLFAGMSEKDVDDVVDAIKNILQ